MKHAFSLVFLVLFATANATVPPPCGLQHKVDNQTLCDYCVSIQYLDCNGNIQVFGIVTAFANTSNGYTLPNAQAILNVRVYDYSACGGGPQDANVGPSNTTDVVGDCAGGTDNVTFLGGTTQITP